MSQHKFLSHPFTTIERMFDAIELPAVEPLHRADDAAVVAAIEGWARVEAQAAARRLAAVAELTVRRCEQGERAD
jgi:hypothetical protein